MKIINMIYRAIRSIRLKILNYLTNKYTYFLMKINFIQFGRGLKSKGIPVIYINKKGRFYIGKNFSINNTIIANPIGRNAQCIFRIKDNGVLKIGDNVGISGTTIVCHKEIIIENNVKIGGNTCIYDTDFHSLEFTNRLDKKRDFDNTKQKKVIIEKNVFIGAHTTILKGVVIGENSIVGACSVVTKHIPKNEIWAGNPAKFIRKIHAD